MAKRSVQDGMTRRVHKALAEKYLPLHPDAQITVYRYNSGSIRVRVIDSVFEGKDIADREDEVLPIIRGLPYEVQEQVSILLLLSPKESERSMLSAEFDHPIPSRL